MAPRLAEAQLLGAEHPLDDALVEEGHGRSDVTFELGVARRLIRDIDEAPQPPHALDVDFPGALADVAHLQEIGECLWHLTVRSLQPRIQRPPLRGREVPHLDFQQLLPVAVEDEVGETVII